MKYNKKYCGYKIKSIAFIEEYIGIFFYYYSSTLFSITADFRYIFIFNIQYFLCIRIKTYFLHAYGSTTFAIHFKFSKVMGQKY